MGVVTTELPPLAALVKSRHEEGRSYREMSENARRKGYAISHSQLQAYATDVVRKAPSTEQLQALSAALDIGFEKVRAASIEQYYGYVPREFGGMGGSMVTAAVPPDLTPAEERELARLVEAWAAARRRDLRG